MIVSGFGDLPWAEALFLCTERRGGAWLAALDGAASITNANAEERTEQAAAIAFTWTGLKQLGLDDDALATFSTPFQEGMHEENRLRRLGDKVDGKWQPTVIPDGPRWSGNTPASPGNGARVVNPTRLTVHALLLLYGSAADAVRARGDQLTQSLGQQAVKVVHRLPLWREAGGIAREHFGFADGLSQPIPYGDSVALSNGAAADKDPLHGVPVGEILLGHMNAHHEEAPGPIVKANVDRASAAGLKASGAPEGFLNLGKNGSYLVVRQLGQDVAAFWRSLEDGAKAIKAQDPTAAVTADWLAARVIGRDKDGNLLVPTGALPPADNNFGFFRTDRLGLGCPLGSHVRRANPRDGLAKDEGAMQTLLDAANNHRILRRGRKYGPTIQNPLEDDGAERGLLFMCLNTDLVRQFEFVQQTWLLNRNFATLYEETDPLVGPEGPFTIPNAPLRRIVKVDTFIRMVGGEYFFLPSLPALKYLAML
jgi:Dyp-type peroxidase family